MEKTELKRKNIIEISTWQSIETTEKDMGFDRVTMLEPTPRNMHRLMEKINELVDLVNKLNQGAETLP
tara:strand:- start:2833 stop:3036 length:204 start_codon:yes stop_codon:yes gene_type:complete